MLLIYRILINLLLILSPIIILIRLLKKKEDPSRFKEKFCIFTKKRLPGKLIWFHGASVGEIRSIVPLLHKLNDDVNINQILITTNTISSEKIISQINLKKITHQYFPIDLRIFSKIFIDYWKPSASFFIDSEIWPNIINKLHKEKIPIILLNGRISEKSFKKWSKIKYFSKKIFNKLDLCLSSNLKTKKYLKTLGAKNIKYLGNLKFTQFEEQTSSINKTLEKFIKGRIIWCAASTHFNEEHIIGQVHKNLKIKYPNLLTIIIPRHINRVGNIKKDLENNNLKVHIENEKSKINKKTDIYLVNSYGNSKTYFKICKNVFLGGSLIKHGGQNPLEAVRFGSAIIHGKYIANFQEIYNFLKNNKISKLVKNLNEITTHLDKKFSEKKNTLEIKKKLDKISRRILALTIREIYFYIE